MNLRNIHNESYVAVYDEGDVKMQGLDGSTNIFIKKVNNNIWHKSDIGDSNVQFFYRKLSIGPFNVITLCILLGGS